MLQRLHRVLEEGPGRPAADPDHPMRKVTLQVAADDGGWTPERAEKVGALFDGLAPTWHTQVVAERPEAVQDALDRGGPWPATGPWLELGSGIGLFSPTLAGHSEGAAVISADLSFEMLVRAPREPPRVQADASRLPFEDNTFATVWLINMLLFPHEVARVLRKDGGAVVWINSLGDATPIHLAPDEVERALPGEWDGVYADAGWGTWTVLRPTRSTAT
jgi:hypothetical protein